MYNGCCREIYLKSFEIAIKRGKPWSVMTGYNRINGTHSDSNPLLLKKILREEWGFDGYDPSPFRSHRTKRKQAYRE